MKHIFFTFLIFFTITFKHLNSMENYTNQPSAPQPTLRPSINPELGNDKIIVELKKQAQDHLNGLLDLNPKDGPNPNLRSIDFVKHTKKLSWRDYQAEIEKWKHSAFQEWNRIVTATIITPQFRKDLLAIKNDTAYKTIEAEAEILKTLDSHYWKMTGCSLIIPTFFGATWYAKDQQETIVLSVGVASFIGVLYILHSTYQNYKKWSLTKNFYNNFCHFKNCILEGKEPEIKLGE